MDGELLKCGYAQLNELYFDTLRIETENKKQAVTIVELAREAGYNLRFVEDKYIGISFDETTTLEDVEAIVRIFGKVKTNPVRNVSYINQYRLAVVSFPPALKRTSPYLQHPVFHRVPFGNGSHAVY